MIRFTGITMLLWLIASNQLYAHREGVSHGDGTARKKIEKLSNYNLYSNLDHKRVQFYIERYSSKESLALIGRDFNRAQPFTSYIKERISFYGLPKELIYLPLVESGYRNQVTSHAGAAGVWQFMKGSSPAYGLAVDQWRDDRLDIYLATDAALRKIRDELVETGDFFLALAAYNGGLGRVLRIKNWCLDQKIEPTFWNMYERNLLPRESLDYVPKFIAVAHLFANAEYYNLNISEDSSDFIVAIESPPSVALSQLASLIDIELSLLYRLNEGLKGRVTPSELSKSYLLKVPSSYEHIARITIAELMTNSGDTIYEVKTGDTLRSISRSTKVSKKQIGQYNRHINFSALKGGERLLLPSKIEANIHRKVVSYQVKRGDSLWAIAARYGLSSQALAQYNNFNEANVLKIGYKLEVPI